MREKNINNTAKHTKNSFGQTHTPKLRLTQTVLSALFSICSCKPAKMFVPLVAHKTYAEMLLLTDLKKNKQKKPSGSREDNLGGLKVNGVE